MVFLYIPAGSAVYTMIDNLTDVLEDGDIIIDGGNSYWGDSIRRYKWLRNKMVPGPGIFAANSGH